MPKVFHAEIERLEIQNVLTMKAQVKLGNKEVFLNQPVNGNTEWYTKSETNRGGRGRASSLINFSSWSHPCVIWYSQSKLAYSYLRNNCQLSNRVKLDKPKGIL
jgi:hypothetical protein